MSRKTEITEEAKIAGTAAGLAIVLSTFAALLLAGSFVMEPFANDRYIPHQHQTLSFTPLPVAPPNPTQPTVLPLTPRQVPLAELEGTWRQYVDGRSLADFAVKINMETGQYEMSLINRSALTTGTRGITNIQYDGSTWSFDSDWGYKTAKFVLRKVDDRTFEGVVEGNQRNKWVRIDEPKQNIEARRESHVPPVTPTPRTTTQRGTAHGSRIDDAIQATVDEIIRDYDGNRVTADQKYKDKWIAVTGRAMLLGTAVDNRGTSIHLAPTGNDWGSFASDPVVRCDFSVEKNNRVSSLYNRAEIVTIVGKCTGRSGAVLLVESEFIDKNTGKPVVAPPGSNRPDPRRNVPATNQNMEGMFMNTLPQNQSSGEQQAQGVFPASTPVLPTNEMGDAEVQFSLGMRYLNGEGISQNDTEAVQQFRKAAEQGHIEAQSILGWCYLQGKGVRQNDAEAVQWLRKAAEQGHAVAESNLGVAYLQGKGIHQNPTEAAKWFRKAAEQGESEAQYNLGMEYFTGIGVPQNNAEAFKWLRRAAEQGHTRAQEALQQVTIKIKLDSPSLGTVAATGSNGISVTWDGVSNANGYRVQYATNASFTTGVNSVDSRTTSVNITNLNPNTIYYVRVIALGGDSYIDSNYSPAKSAATEQVNRGQRPRDGRVLREVYEQGRPFIPSDVRRFLP